MCCRFFGWFFFFAFLFSSFCSLSMDLDLKTILRGNISNKYFQDQGCNSCSLVNEVYISCESLVIARMVCGASPNCLKKAGYGEFLVWNAQKKVNEAKSLFSLVFKIKDGRQIDQAFESASPASQNAVWFLFKQVNEHAERCFFENLYPAELKTPGASGEIANKAFMLAFQAEDIRLSSKADEEWPWAVREFSRKMKLIEMRQRAKKKSVDPFCGFFSTVLSLINKKG